MVHPSPWMEAGRQQWRSMSMTTKPAQVKESEAIFPGPNNAINTGLTFNLIHSHWRAGPPYLQVSRNREKRRRGSGDHTAVSVSGGERVFSQTREPAGETPLTCGSREHWRLGPRPGGRRVDDACGCGSLPGFKRDSALVSGRRLFQPPHLPSRLV